ncbi:MAG: hypothetical protein DWQ37_02440 [Planctomycetota bacterium]|nr:MAG: hypothetical protein DWQ37_02440 [Planctomycetota bacterium]
MERAPTVNETDWVTLASTDTQRSQLLLNLLKEHGIDAQIAGGNSALGDLPMRSVLIPAEQSEAARAVLTGVAESMREGSSSPELAELESLVGEDDPWPVCIHCGRARTTRCPVCSTSGEHFEQAFMPHVPIEGASAPERALVICPTCDEAFAPEYLSRCEWCGHQFSDGIAPPPEDFAPPVPSAFAEIGLRAVAMAAVLVALMGALAGWFYFVLR